VGGVFASKNLIMASWEDIANEIAPTGAPVTGLATGANRGRKTKIEGGSLAQVLGANRFLECPAVAKTDGPDTIWGGREESNEAGSYYFIDRAIVEYDSQNAGLLSRLQCAMANPPSSFLEGLAPEDLLFCDIETMGLSSSEPLFLIGAMRVVKGELRLQLFLARTLDEEKAAITAFSKIMRGKTLVTFNGKSFDWPFIEGRATRNLVRLPKPAGHFDLIFSARRRYRGQLPNCRLQTLEMGICKRGRKGDIPSSQIPDRYYDFLEISENGGQGAYLLAPILFHNALDVLTMAELICCMAEGN
jgi:uncharacterized protein YprB with RNaseH-like and TPR domain